MSQVSKGPRGDSTVQREAEAAIRAALESDYGDLKSIAWEFSDGTKVEIDAVSENRKILVEIFARQGSLLDGQRRKLAKDILKLALVCIDVPDAKDLQLIIAHANPAITKYLTKESWLALATKRFGIKEIDMSNRLTEDLKMRIKQAQLIQGEKFRNA
jgi:hypothetical protein